MLELLKNKLDKAQLQMKRIAYNKRWDGDVNYNVGDCVYVMLLTATGASYHKLAKLTKRVGPVAYRLSLP